MHGQMKTRHKRWIAPLAALAVSAALAGPALAADGPPPPCPAGERDAPPPPPPHGPFGPLALAGRLAALETYVGITPAQMDAWRAYTTALQALGPPPRPAPDATKLPGEDMAAEAVNRAETARRLLTAIETLRAALTPDQLERLREGGHALHAPPPGRPMPPRPDDMNPGGPQALGGPQGFGGPQGTGTPRRP